MNNRKCRGKQRDWKERKCITGNVAASRKELRCEEIENKSRESRNKMFNREQFRNGNGPNPSKTTFQTHFNTSEGRFRRDLLG
jgi:hypothetical protein